MLSSPPKTHTTKLFTQTYLYICQCLVLEAVEGMHGVPAHYLAGHCYLTLPTNNNIRRFLPYKTVTRTLLLRHASNGCFSHLPLLSLGLEIICRRMRLWCKPRKVLLIDTYTHRWEYKMMLNDWISYKLRSQSYELSYDHDSSTTTTTTKDSYDIIHYHQHKIYSHQYKIIGKTQLTEMV